MPPRSKLGEIPRQEMPARSPEERRKDFKEVPLGYTEEQAYQESLRCLDCKVPHCMEGCPAKVKIPEFIGLVAEKKFLEAAKKIKELGGEFQSSVGKSTDYLVIGEKAGASKRIKAEQLGTKVIDEDELLRMLS